MKVNYLPFITFELRQDIEKQGFMLPGRLFIDGERYLLEGISGRCSYIAFLEDFGGTNIIVACSYGLINAPKQHSFSREVPKEQIKIC